VTDVRDVVDVIDGCGDVIFFRHTYVANSQFSNSKSQTARWRMGNHATA
jgi:hypothetical protein